MYKKERFLLQVFSQRQEGFKIVRMVTRVPSHSTAQQCHDGLGDNLGNEALGKSSSIGSITTVLLTVQVTELLGVSYFNQHHNGLGNGAFRNPLLVSIYGGVLQHQWWVLDLLSLYEGLLFAPHLLIREGRPTTLQLVKDNPSFF